MQAWQKAGHTWGNTHAAMRAGRLGLANRVGLLGWVGGLALEFIGGGSRSAELAHLPPAWALAWASASALAFMPEAMAEAEASAEAKEMGLTMGMGFTIGT